MATNLLFLFRINDDGSQTTLVRHEVDHTVSWEEFVQWGRDNLPAECGEYQTDAVNEETVHASLPGNSDYATLMWELWQLNVVGNAAIEGLGGMYTAQFLSVEECETTETTEPTIDVVTVPEPTVPTTVVTSTTVVAPADTVPTTAPATVPTTAPVPLAPLPTVTTTTTTVEVATPFTNTAQTLPTTGPGLIAILLVIVLVVIALGTATLAIARWLRGLAATNNLTS